MKKYITGFIFFSFSLALFALPLKGWVLDSGAKKPVAYAVVIILETESTADTAEDGSFLLDAPDYFPFTVRVLSDMYVPRNLSVFSSVDDPFTILLESLTVDMGMIEATAQRSGVKESTHVDTAQVKTISTGNDPFALVDRAPDVSSPSQPALDNDFNASKKQLEQALGAPILGLLNPFHYRGLPFYANTYFIEAKIPLFFQYYSFSGNVMSSIFPSSILSGMEMYGNGRKPAVGPGAGLLSSLEIKEPAGSIKQEIYASTLATGYSLEGGAKDGSSGFMMTVRKSLFEFVVSPIIAMLNSEYYWFGKELMGNEPLKFTLQPGTVDAFMHLFKKIPGDQIITLTAFNASGYTKLDFEGIAPGGTYTNVFFGNLNQESGLSADWLWKPDATSSLDLTIYDVLAWTSKSNGQKLLGGEEFSSDFDYPLNDLGGRLEYEASMGSLNLEAGMSGRFLMGWFERTQVAHPLLAGLIEKDHVFDSGLKTGEVSAWLDPSLTFGKFELEPGVRLDFMPLIGSGHFYDDIRASPSLHIFYYPEDGQTLHLGGAMRFDRFDYLTRHAFIAERGVAITTFPATDGAAASSETIDDRFVQKYPSRVFSVESEYTLEKNSYVLKASAYGLYADKLSGFDFQSFFVAAGDEALEERGNASILDAGFKSADAMWSSGASAEYSVKASKPDGKPAASLDISYSFGVARYHADMKGNGNFTWIVPNSDTSHTVKVYGYLSTRKNWNFGATLKTFIGIPQTPNESTGITTGLKSKGSEIVQYNIVAYRPIEGATNTLRDYMPRFGFDFKVAKEFKGRVDWEIFLDAANVLSFPRYVGPNTDVAGFRETSPRDRTYSWVPFSLGNLPSMRIDLGVCFRF